MLFLNILAILAPVAVVYDGGGVYFGGASSVVDTPPDSKVIVAGIACIGLGRSVRGSEYLAGCCCVCGTRDGRYNN